MADRELEGMSLPRKNNSAYIFLTQIIYDTTDNTSTSIFHNGGGKFKKLVQKVLCSCIWRNKVHDDLTFTDIEYVVPNVVDTSHGQSNGSMEDPGSLDSLGSLKSFMNQFAFLELPKKQFKPADYIEECYIIAKQRIEKSKINDTKNTHLHIYIVKFHHGGKSVYAITSEVFKALQENPVAQESFDRFLVAIHLVAFMFFYQDPNVSIRIKYIIYQFQLIFLQQIKSIKDLIRLMQSCKQSIYDQFLDKHIEPNVLKYLAFVDIYCSLFKDSLQITNDTIQAFYQAPLTQDPSFDISVHDPIRILESIHSLRQFNEAQPKLFNLVYFQTQLVNYMNGASQDISHRLFIGAFQDLVKKDASELKALNLTAQVRTILKRVNESTDEYAKLCRIAGALTVIYHPYKNIFREGIVTKDTACIMSLSPLVHEPFNFDHMIFQVSLNGDGQFEAALTVVAQTINVHDNIYTFAIMTVRGEGGDWFEIGSIYNIIVNMLVNLHDQILKDKDAQKQKLLLEYLYKETLFKDTGVTVMKPIGANVSINKGPKFAITQIGGRPTKPTHLIYKLNNKQYKIRQDGRKRFILVKKEPIYLKDIPGKYSFIKTT